MSSTYVTLVPLAFRQAEDEYVVGPQVGSDFVELPEIGALAVRALQIGHSLEEVGVLMAAHAGQDVDVRDFLSQLDDLGWVQDVGPDPPPPPQTARAVRTSPVVRALFSRIAWIAYAALAGFDVAMLATGAVPMPSVSALIESHSPAAVMIVALTTSLMTLVIHEWWHLMGARAAGVDASISLGRRWLTPVAQTDLSRMWLLPRHARFGPILAGPAVDGVMLAAMLGLSASGFAQGGLTGLIVGIMVLGLLGGLGFQLQVYMRTDGYALLTTAFGCRNLSGVAAARARQLLRRASSDDELTLEHAHPSDRRAAPVFHAIVALGLAWTVWFFAVVGLPAFVSTTSWILAALNEGSSADRVQALLIIALSVMQIAWLGVAVARERRARRRTSSQTRNFAQVHEAEAR